MREISPYHSIIYRPKGFSIFIFFYKRTKYLGRTNYMQAFIKKLKRPWCIVRGLTIMFLFEVHARYANKSWKFQNKSYIFILYLLHKVWYGPGIVCPNEEKHNISKGHSNSLSKINLQRHGQKKKTKWQITEYITQHRKHGT